LSDLETEPGSSERWCVVDAVAEHSDALAASVQALHLRSFIVGQHARQDTFDPELRRYGCCPIRWLNRSDKHGNIGRSDNNPDTEPEIDFRAFHVGDSRQHALNRWYAAFASHPCDLEGGLVQGWNAPFEFINTVHLHSRKLESMYAFHQLEGQGLPFSFSAVSEQRARLLQHPAIQK
jgi:hypothetical protein